MTNATPEQLELARKIAADTITQRVDWLPGVKAGIHEEIIAGKHDDEAGVRIALAAIIETSNRAIREVESGGHPSTDYAAKALRNQEHLKDD